MLLNFFFEFIDIRYFFSSLKLRHCRTIVLLNKLKFLKKRLFHKRRWSCDFPPRKTLVAQKHRAISCQEKRAFSSPRRVALGLPSPSPRVCTDERTDGREGGRAYADVTTKISRIDRLPNFLTRVAPLLIVQSTSLIV